MNRKRWTVLFVSAAFLFAGAYYFIMLPRSSDPASDPADERATDNDRSATQISVHEGHGYAEHAMEGSGHSGHEHVAEEGASPSGERPDESDRYGLHNTGARRIWAYHQIQMEEGGFDNYSGMDTLGEFNVEGDIGAFYEDFKELQTAVERLKAGEINMSDLETLINKKEHNSDWMAYLRVYVKREIGYPLSIDEKSFIGGSNFELRRLFGKNWRENNLGDEVSRRLLPIQDFRHWAATETPAEHRQFDERYSELADEQLEWDVDRFEHAKGVEERVDAMYGYFVTALSEMPPDARIFEYFGIDRAVSPPAPVETPQHLPSGAPGVNSPASADPSLPGASSSSSESTPREPSQVEPVSPPPPDDPAIFEAAVMQSIERYGVQEGMRRLAGSHPAWAERIVLWAQERQKRLTPRHGNESE